METLIIVSSMVICVILVKLSTKRKKEVTTSHISLDKPIDKPKSSCDKLKEEYQAIMDQPEPVRKDYGSFNSRFSYDVKENYSGGACCNKVKINGRLEIEFKFDVVVCEHGEYFNEGATIDSFSTWVNIKELAFQIDTETWGHVYKTLSKTTVRHKEYPSLPYTARIWWSNVITKSCDKGFIIIPNECIWDKRVYIFPTGTTNLIANKVIKTLWECGLDECTSLFQDKERSKEYIKEIKESLEEKADTEYNQALSKWKARGDITLTSGAVDTISEDL